MLVDTACKDCIFAEYNRLTQIGCKLGRLDKFREQGSEVQECYDADKEFYVVKGRMCLACRNHDWGNRHPQDKWESIVRGEMVLRMNIYVYITEDTTINDIKKTFNSITKQVLHPARTIAILNQDHLIPTRVIALFEQCNTKPWQVEQITLQEEETGKRVSRERAVDWAIKKCKSSYYTCVNAGYKFPRNFLLNIDRALNDNLDRFALLLPANPDGPLVVQTQLHKFADGNKPLRSGFLKNEPEDDGDVLCDIKEKIFFLAKENNQEFMVKRLEEICPTQE